MKLIQTKEYLMLISKDTIGVGDYFYHAYPYDLSEPDNYYINKCTEVLVDMQTEQEPDGGVLGYRDEIAAIVAEDYYCSKLLAYYPLTNEAKELDLPLLPEPFKEEIDIEKLAERAFPLPLKIHNRGAQYHTHLGRNPYKGLKKWIKAFTVGYKAAGQFSLEDMQKAYFAGVCSDNYDISPRKKTQQDFEDFIQSLSTQQLPINFDPEFEVVGQCDCICHTPGVEVMHFMACCHPTSKLKIVDNIIQGAYKY